MRKDLGKNMLFLPLPVVVIGTYDKAGKPNAMTAAWATVYDFGKVFVSLSPHKTTKNIKATKAFTLHFATKETAVISDYFGIVSGNKEDKIAKAKVHVIKSKHVNAPIFDEYPVAIECKLHSLEDGNLIGDIVGVSVDNKYVANARVKTDKMNLICYDMTDHSYREIGKKIATGFSCGAKLKNKGE